MSGPGARRTRIEQALATAYGDGLLSQETFVSRLDALAASRVVDPVPLVGDLSVRAAESTLKLAVDRVRGMVARAVSALPVVAGETSPLPAAALLELDWGGGEEELMLGRHHACDVVLTDVSVSRRHAQLRFRDGAWILQDLESTNGTRVNGAPVGRCRLRPGDELALGECRLVVD